MFGAVLLMLYCLHHSFLSRNPPYQQEAVTYLKLGAFAMNPACRAKLFSYKVVIDSFIYLAERWLIFSFTFMLHFLLLSPHFHEVVAGK